MAATSGRLTARPASAMATLVRVHPFCYSAAYAQLGGCNVLITGQKPLKASNKDISRLSRVAHDETLTNTPTLYPPTTSVPRQGNRPPLEENDRRPSRMPEHAK